MAQYKEGLFFIINTCLWKVATSKRDKRSILSDEFIIELYNLCLAESKNASGLNPDSLNCIIAISEIIENDFLGKLHDTLSMVSLALTTSNSEMIKVGLETMSHFIRLFKEECKEFN